MVNMGDDREVPNLLLSFFLFFKIWHNHLPSKFNRTLHYNKKERPLPILIHYFQKSLLRFISLIAYVFVKNMGFFSMGCRI